MNKDIIVEIALRMHPSDAINFSLTCKKYHEYLFQNIHYWRQKIIYDFGHVCVERTIRKCVGRFILLENISENPNSYYRKSIREKDEKLKSLIEEVFKVNFPYIGIISNDPDYFSVIDVEAIKNNLVPEELDIKNAGYLTICYYARNMGIHIYMDSEKIIPLIKINLEKLGLIYKVGESYP